MKRGNGFNRARPERQRTVHSPIPEHLRRGASMVVLHGEFSAPVEKCEAKKIVRGTAEREHKAKLALMGCMVCRRLFGPHEPGPVELHHLRGGGWGKGDWTTLIPLCPEHHRGRSGVHGLGTKGFPKHYGFDQADLLADVQQVIKGDGCAKN
jgi:hypothetical protein